MALKSLTSWTTTIAVLGVGANGPIDCSFDVKAPSVSSILPSTNTVPIVFRDGASFTKADLDEINALVEKHGDSFARPRIPVRAIPTRG